MLSRRCFLLGSTAALAALPAAGAPLRLTLVITGGTRSVAGPSAPIDIVDDKFGIPHIRAATIPDAYFGQGYVVARDRLF
jgi:penicillin G amidase